MRTVTTTMPYGDAETRMRVRNSGKWRVRFPGAFIDPAQYMPSISVERRIDVIICL